MNEPQTQTSVSRIVGLLAIVVQVLNFALMIAGALKPTWSVWIAAALGAVSAFTARIQGSSATAKGQ